MTPADMSFREKKKKVLPNLWVHKAMQTPQEGMMGHSMNSY